MQLKKLWFKLILFMQNVDIGLHDDWCALLEFVVKNRILFSCGPDVESIGREVDKAIYIYSQSYMVFPVVMYRCESLTIKKAEL